MNIKKSSRAAFIVLLLSISACVSQAIPNWDLTGQWDLLYTVANYTTDLRMDIQSQDFTTGSFQGVALNDPIGVSAGSTISGAVQGDSFFLTGYTTWGEWLRMDGTVAANGTLSGSVTWNSFHGPWGGGFGTTSGRARSLVPDTGSTAFMAGVALAILALIRRRFSLFAQQFRATVAYSQPRRSLR